MMRNCFRRHDHRHGSGWRWSIGVLATLLLTVIGGWAQSTTSGIFGTVEDNTGAVVVGADVTAVNTATGVAYKATTTSTGLYRVTQLPPGSYVLKISKTGFAPQNTLPFTLFVDQQSQQNVTLAVGTEVQTVQVSATALLLDTETSNQGQVIENQQINDMPLNGRDYLQLAQLSAGVVPIVSGVSSPASGWSAAGTVAVVIGGLREDDNSYLYDGVETRNAWYGAAGLQPSPDAIQEFKVEQSGSSAQYGVGGAFINVVTRSGTNAFHGTAYEYLRNNDFDARNYFDATSGPAPFHQNQFGAAFGGPIRRNKMFFFLNYEGFRQSQPDNLYNLVPTGPQKSGDFSADTNQLYNPFVLDPSTPTGYAILPGNQVPSQYWNSIGQKILAMYPDSNGSYNGGTTNRYDVATTTNNWDQGNARFDWQISTKDTVFTRWTQNNQNVTTPGMTSYNEQLYPSAPKNLAIGWTRTFSPSLVNNVRYGWAHTAVGLQRGDGYDKSLVNPLGLQNEDDQPGAYGPPNIGVSGYANPGSTNGTDLVREGLSMWTESLLWQKGHHQITTGVDIRYEPLYLFEDWSATNISFNGTYTGDPVADLLMGVPINTRTSLGDPTMNLKMWYQSYYVEDSWQASPKLTLNYGVRWEHRAQPVEDNNRVGSFDVTTGQDLTYPDTSAMGLGRNMVKPRWANLSPRFGFNWQPLSKNSLDVKGGFGMYWLQANINQYEVEVDTTKLYEVSYFTNPGAGQTPDFTLNDLYSTEMTSGHFSGGGPTVSFIDPNAKTPMAYEWNLSIDKTVRDWLFELTYMGSAEHHFEERPEIDPYIPGTNQPTHWTNFDGVQENTASGNSIYHGLALRTEKRFNSGYSTMVNYTWSKCLGMPYQDEFNWHVDMHRDYGHCTEDINQILSANGIYELPFGQGKPFMNVGGLKNAVVGGWKVAGIVSLHTGAWTTLGGNQGMAFFMGGLPDVIGPVNNKSLHGGLGRHQKLGPYFNTQNVIGVTGVSVNGGVPSTTGVQGNAPVHSLMNPGTENFDLSGYKGWKYGERYNLTLRGDFFNAFNRVNFNTVDSSISDTTFGDVTSAAAAREIQLSLRLDF